MKQYALYLAFITMSLSCTAGTAVADTSASLRQVSVLTYNVKFLPRFAFTIHHHPVRRARVIPAKLIEENADVIVIQEGFDGFAIRTLKRRLKKAYPYTMGFKNHIVFTYRKAGGVLMFSKYPMKEIESIRYSQCKGIDCIGHKGCLLAEVQHPAMKFQVLGTHMQAGGADSIKFSQYKEAGELLQRHEQQGVPQFAAGDFNTYKTRKNMYDQLVKCLSAEDGDISGDLLFTSDHLLNDMEKYRPDKRNLIDFIFYKGNGITPVWTKRYIRQFQEQWTKKHKDLSDHFSVVLKMQL